MNTPAHSELEIVLKEEKLANGVFLQLIDRSGILAADRWTVRLLCRFTVKVDESLWSTLDDFPDRQTIMEMIGPELVHEQKKERQFIADSEKDAVINDLICQAEELLPYASSPRFVEALLEKRVKEARMQLAFAPPPASPAADEDDEPADFSHLFTDN
jgi:hypothetical protein